MSIDVTDGKVSALRALILPERTVESVESDIEKISERYLGAPLDKDHIKVLRPASSSGEGRRRLGNLNVDRSDQGISVKVSLERDGDLLAGEKQTVDPSPDAAYLAVVEAVLDALAPLLSRDTVVAGLELIEMPGSRVAYVSLSSGGRRYSGSALDKRGADDAFARATLQALNRVSGEIDR